MKVEDVMTKPLGEREYDETTCNQIRAGSLVDTVDRFVGWRGDLFRVASARLLDRG
ncbi:MAG: hypothetical protein ACREBD_36275 [Blastocatellia bacterium]